MKNGQQRRNKIIEMLTGTEEPINATAIAAALSVTRQIIVSDIALLRAAGYKIRSLHRGYMLEAANDGLISKQIVCKHTKEKTINEFYSIVDNGGQVENVSVEHPIYGRITADLEITSRYDAEKFVEKTKSEDASQLSLLTGGVHIHTILAKDEAVFERICNSLAAQGILIEKL